MKHKIIPKRKLSELHKNDLFLYRFTTEHNTWRVHRETSDALLAHSMSWIKSDSILIPKSDREVYYLGRMSKLRSFFVM